MSWRQRTFAPPAVKDWFAYRTAMHHPAYCSALAVETASVAAARIHATALPTAAHQRNLGQALEAQTADSRVPADLVN
jgi:hypothetical protein